MTVDITKLKALAEAAKNDCGDYVALNDYGMAVPPAVILELIGRLEVSESMEGLYTSTVTVERAELEQTKRGLESHKRMLLSAAVSIGTIGEALGAEMDDDPSELEGLAAELRKDAEFHQQVQRAAGELPYGWQILIRIEKDSGNAELIDPEGNEVDYPSNHECLADSVSDAIDEALSVEKNG